MRIKLVSMALMGVAGLAMSVSSASANFTFPSFSLLDRATNDAWKPHQLNDAIIPAGTYVSFEIFLNWSSNINSGSFANAWSNEAQVSFANAATTGGTGAGSPPNYPGGTVIHSAVVNSSNGANNSNNVTNLRLAGAFGTNYTSGPLYMNNRQQFSGVNIVDWNDIRVTLKTAATPVAGDTQATAIDLGTLGYGGMIMATGQSDAGTVNGKWFKLNLAAAVGAGDLHTYLDLHTNGSSFDTEFGIFDSLGNHIANDDDDGQSLRSLLTFGTGSGLMLGDLSDAGAGIANGRDGAMLAAGDYYIFLGGFDTAFAATNFGVTPGSSAGSYKLTIIPAPASAALMGLGGLFVARRRRTR